MISYVKGKLVAATPGFAIIDVNGVGYKVLVPASTFTQLPQLGKETLLYTSLVVREISQTLYGFISEEERDFFERVTGVSGIGPKIALSLIGHLPLNEMFKAINHNDIIAISRVPGIGKKTAQRLIIEMRDKLSPHVPENFAIEFKSDSQREKISDAMSALMNLGYNQATAQKALKKSLEEDPETADLSTLITNALKIAALQ